MTASARGPTNPDRPVVSQFVDDPDMRELLELFVAEMPCRAEQLRTAAAASDISSLRRLAHQLKGAGGGYGFSTISNAAGRVETLAAELLSRRIRDDPHAAALSAAVTELVDLCTRAVVEPGAAVSARHAAPTRS